jgi:hypothetical protein
VQAQHVFEHIEVENDVVAPAGFVVEAIAAGAAGQDVVSNAADDLLETGPPAFCRMGTAPDCSKMNGRC